MAVGTQAVKGRLALAWAQLAGVSPALAWHLAAAALGLSGVEGFGHRTLARLKAGEAEALSSIKAAASIVRQNEAMLTDTLEASWGVGACAKLADIWLHLTLVDIYTLVVLDLVSSWADTAEGSIQVLTDSRRAGPRKTHTFIDINTVLSVLGEFVAFLTETLEGSQAVDTLAVPTHLTHQRTALINVHAVIVVRELEAREAETVVGAHRVLTGSIPTRLSVTLINIHAHGLVGGGLESVVTETAVAALGVDTLSMTTHVRDLLALVTVHAGPAGGQLEAW